jgi:hypothetical protein
MNPDLEPFLDRWLTDGPQGVPDRVLSGALDRIALTPQRHRRPAPWSVLEMSSALRVIVLTLIVVGAGALVAGSFGVGPIAPAAPATISASPSATPVPAQPSEPVAVVVTGTSTGLRPCGHCSWGLDLSDPRVSGVEEEGLAESYFGDPGARNLTGSISKISTDGGTWLGRSVAFGRSMGVTAQFAWYTGTGDYDGWSYVQVVTGTGGTYGGMGTPGADGDYQVRGVLYRGKLPAEFAALTPAPRFTQWDDPSLSNAYPETVLIDGTSQGRRGCGGCSFSLALNDPRVSGTELTDAYYYAGLPDSLGLIGGDSTVTNDQGTWAGKSIALIDPNGEADVLGWYRGSGAHDGWTYVQGVTGSGGSYGSETAPGTGGHYQVTGYLYRAELPYELTTQDAPVVP